MSCNIFYVIHYMVFDNLLSIHKNVSPDFVNFSTTSPVLRKSIYRISTH